MDFNQNYFEIFGLPINFRVDTEQLAKRYRQLQRELHPDRFVGGTEHEKRLSMQWSALLNTANETLRLPLPRAIYMLEQKGLVVDPNPQLSPEFMMEQIELREELEALEDGAAGLDRVDEFKKRAHWAMANLGEEFADSNDDEKALTVVYEMQFLSKLLVVVDQLEEKLLGY